MKPGSREPQIFLDVTDLITWKGPRTGIQRVTYEFALGLLATSPACLIAYAGAPLGYIELDETALTAGNGKPAFPTRHSIGRRLRRTRRTRTPNFAEGDAIILTGGGWIHTQVLEELKRLKDQPGVRVHRFIHDVMPLTEPQFFHPDEIAQFSGYTTSALAISESILTSSEWNVQQITKLFAADILPVRPIHTVKFGDDALLREDPVPPALDLPDRAFTLIVGSLDVRKNLRVVHQAYQLALARGAELPHLVLAGPRGRMWQEAEHLIGRDIRLGTRTTVATEVTDAELAWLYRNCSYTIYPSLCEGWGLPIRESLAFGKPCICSNTSAMPEVGGAAAHYFDPHNPVELLEHLLSFAKTETVAAEHARIEKDFTLRRWTTAAAELRAVTIG
jgi:glycosyltransferase involved in cell wall biosynthesis